MAKTSAEAVRQIDENVLRTIKQLQLRKGKATVTEIAGQLDMLRPTAYAAINRLVNNGYLQPLKTKGGRREHNSLEFTPEGEVLAADLMEKHQMLQKWLIRLGLPPQDADREACYFEHGISDQIMDVIRRHVSMASEMVSDHESSAPQLMEKMREMMSGKNYEGTLPSTLSEDIQTAIAQAGGLEGVRRMMELTKRSGGVENAERILERVRELGGLEKIEADLKDRDDTLSDFGGKANLEALAGFARKYHDAADLDTELKELENIRDHLANLGNLRTVRSQLEALEQMGGIPAFRKLTAAAEAFGGPEEAARVLNREYKLWEGVFREKTTKE